MNLFLVLLGLVISFVPTILTIVVLVVVVRGQRRLRDEIHTLRTEVEQRGCEKYPSL